MLQHLCSILGYINTLHTHTLNKYKLVLLVFWIESVAPLHCAASSIRWVFDDSGCNKFRQNNASDLPPIREPLSTKAGDFSRFFMNSTFHLLIRNAPKKSNEKIFVRYLHYICMIFVKYFCAIYSNAVFAEIIWRWVVMAGRPLTREM